MTTNVRRDQTSARAGGYDGLVTAAGFPPICALIEVHVSDLNELFNSIDPAPFLKRDLDPSAEFIASAEEREIDEARRSHCWCMSIASEAIRRPTEPW